MKPSAFEARRRAVAHAHADFVRGLVVWRLWLGLATQDIRIRYKRTFLGPLWITASMTATFVTMGMLFSAVYKTDVRVFLPYLASGMVVWSFISAVAIDGPQIFVDAQHLIHSLRIPLVVHVMRSVMRNGMIFLHNLVSALITSVVLGGSVTVDSLLLLAYLPVLVAIGFSGGLILAIVGSRFRDLGPVIGMVTQMMFFMTPIMWRPEDIPGGSKWWVTANPAYHLVEIVRAPLLGTAPAMISVVVAATSAVVLCLVAHGLFCLFRQRISYWL